MIDSGPDEVAIGLELYYTDSPGTGGRLKHAPEDFKVEEVSAYPPHSEGGRYTIARVTAENWEMNRLIRRLSRALGVGRNRIGFAGTKDKRAVTSQLMSFPVPIEKLMRLDLHQIEISEPYPAERGISIGSLIGNAFTIRATDTDLQGSELTSVVSTTRDQLESLGGFPNFFGVQRFGIIRPITHEVGKWIVRGDLEKAVMTYAANPFPNEKQDSQEARRKLEEDRDFKAALDYYPKVMNFERNLIGHLSRFPDDYAGAISSLPPNLQMMFVHAYQSYLFNRILSERLRKSLPLDRPIVGDIVLPADRNGLPQHDGGVPVTSANIDLVDKQVRQRRAFISGVLFGTESVLAEGEMGEIERSVIEDEGLSNEDFMIPSLHTCSSKGTRRELLGVVKDFNYLAQGNSITFSFTLNKGCYATSLLREYLKNEDLTNY
ncbi:MAG: tRNA pseudouridine(13) synthase TruD [Euryarchaeota archaeon]|nr:tRNA pseudouridine(13) synthase TruD [Euryarchaeota archaeon]